MDRSGALLLLVQDGWIDKSSLHIVEILKIN
jgi:hypothetical protein